MIDCAAFTRVLPAWHGVQTVLISETFKLKPSPEHLTTIRDSCMQALALLSSFFSSGSCTARNREPVLRARAAANERSTLN